MQQHNASLNIAFDAKRIYQNGTGLGHYSRTLVSSLAACFPQHQYYLCAPKITDRFNIERHTNLHNITPQTFLAKKFPSLWRSRLVNTELQKIPANIYHGLSHEIPVGLQHTGIKSVVTIHDLIHERYPQQYNWFDTKIYTKKFTYACQNANHVIAISHQTKSDIIEFYKIPSEKISVCYQSCNPAFAEKVAIEEKLRVKKLFNLPDQYFLYVGSIIERKNLLQMCKAYQQLKGKLQIPLVVIGEGEAYKQQVQQFVKDNDLTSQIIFLSDTAAAKSSRQFQTAEVFPAIYQMAMGMVYPSIFEGFGIPVLEALWSGIPVITSNVSCLPETGGDAALYVDPYSTEEIAAALLQLSTEPERVQTMVEKGYRHAQNFTAETCATAVMQVYLRL